MSSSGTRPIAVGAWDAWHMVAEAVIAAAVVLVGWVIPASFGPDRAGDGRLWTWLAAMALVAAFIVVAAHAITGLWTGFLVDQRNKTSLARLQWFLWLIVIVPGLLAAGLSNVVLHGAAGALAITIPAHLLLLLGISTTSAVGASLILSAKRTTPVPPPAQSQQGPSGTAPATPPVHPALANTQLLITKQEGVNPTHIVNDGLVLAKTNLDDARLADLFKGDDVGNGAYLDLSKVQMFFFTVILVMVYAATLAAAFYDHPSQPFAAFPDVDQSMAFVLGISQAGYLTYKAVPHN